MPGHRISKAKDIKRSTTGNGVMADALMLTNMRLPRGERRSIGVSGAGHFVDAADLASSPHTRIDCDANVVIPGLVDAHLHLDKTLLGGAWRSHTASDSVAERIRNERLERRRIPVPLSVRAEALLQLAISQGTTALRTHVDIDDDIGLEGLEAILNLREQYRPQVHIDIVAFPQSGIVRCPGVADLLDAALRAGADAIGGLDPYALDQDRDAHLKVVFDLADKHAKKIDIHLHELGVEGRRSVAGISEYTRASGMGGRVTISHAFCLGDGSTAEISVAADDLARSGVAIITAAPGASPIPAIDTLTNAGVRVAAGSDNVRDLWSPFGNASMIERCMLVCWRSGWRRDDALERSLKLATFDAAAILGLDDYGLEPGCLADAVVLPALNIPQAIVERPAPLLVMSRGQIRHRATTLKTTTADERRH
jgi:cytosine/adenosine deaminase-related metal-dependent hydrolase